MSQPEASGHKSTPPSNKLRIVTCSGMADFEDSIRKAIAYRAYELYESRGRRDGSDMGDWFSAERELVKPTNVQIVKSYGQISVRATVAGFSADNIRLGVSLNRLIIWGEAARPGESGGSTHLLGEINLSAPVDPSKAAATLTGETLEFRVPKEKSNAA